ncbi:MAG: riboflavin synthase [Ignavibacteria bacterium]
MFTGIIQEIGRVVSRTNVGGGIHFTIEAPQSASALAVNDSVAMNGVCLTVIERSSHAFTVEAVEETLKKTTLAQLDIQQRVNLELPLKVTERLGGHIVLGHVDGVGVVTNIVQRETSWLFEFAFPSNFRRYIIPVGSIAIDGVSLTVAELGEHWLRVSIIPHTWSNTTFQFLHVGEKVNLEFDVIGKYIESLMSAQTRESSFDVATLRAWGYDV